MTANPIQVQKFLGGLDFPADRQKILSVAREHGADDRVLETLDKPSDRTHDGPDAISKEIFR